MADEFRFDCAISNRCHSQVRNVYRISKHVGSLFLGDRDVRFICIGFKNSGIGFLNPNFKLLMAVRSVFGCLRSVFFVLGFKNLSFADAFVIASL